MKIENSEVSFVREEENWRTINLALCASAASVGAMGTAILDTPVSFLFSPFYSCLFTLFQHRPRSRIVLRLWTFQFRANRKPRLGSGNSQRMASGLNVLGNTQG